VLKESAISASHRRRQNPTTTSRCSNQHFVFATWLRHHILQFMALTTASHFCFTHTSVTHTCNFHTTHAFSFPVLEIWHGPRAISRPRVTLVTAGDAVPEPTACTLAYTGLFWRLSWCGLLHPSLTPRSKHSAHNCLIKYPQQSLTSERLTSLLGNLPLIGV
jgi:hypothetical protein